MVRAKYALIHGRKVVDYQELKDTQQLYVTNNNVLIIVYKDI